MQVFRSFLARLGRRIRVDDKANGPNARPAGRGSRLRSVAREKKAPVPLGLKRVERGEAFGIERAVEDEHRPMIAASLQSRLQQRADEIDGKGSVDCPRCEMTMKNKGRQKRRIHGSSGPVIFWRSRFCCKPCGVTLYPADEILGLPRREYWTPLALSRLVLLSVLMPFLRAAEIAHLFFGMAITDNRIWKAVQRVGRGLVARHEEEAAACDDVETCPDVTVGGKERGRTRSDKMIQIVPDGAMVLMRPGEGGQPRGHSQDEDPVDEGYRRCGGARSKDRDDRPCGKGADVCPASGQRFGKRGRIDAPRVGGARDGQAME